MNARELLDQVEHWLGWQNEDLSAGLKSAFDALRLYEYWTDPKNQHLPEFCDMDYDDEDHDIATERVNALGYDPLAKCLDESVIGTKSVMGALAVSYTLIDSVAFIKKEGDTDKVLKMINDIF